MSLEVLIQEAVTAGVQQALAGLALSSPAPIKLGYTIPEAVQISSCTEWDIRNAIKRGELPAKQAGARGKYVIHHEHLNAWLKGQKPQTTNTARKGVRQARPA